jgi:hypothetical protein
MAEQMRFGGFIAARWGPSLWRRTRGFFASRVARPHELLDVVMGMVENLTNLRAI